MQPDAPTRCCRRWNTTKPVCGLWPAVFDNVAIDQWRLPLGYTAVNGSYNRRERDYSWQGSASTYTHYRSSTLCGGAAYSNGKRRNMPWCETTDPELLYPYLLADTVGGDLNSEIYTFSGSYADHSDRWAWGASLAYKATLEYRSVDPRPRNVAGCLDASTTIGWGATLLFGATPRATTLSSNRRWA